MTTHVGGRHCATGTCQCEAFGAALDAAAANKISAPPIIGVSITGTTIATDAPLCRVCGCSENQPCGPSGRLHSWEELEQLDDAGAAVQCCSWIEYDLCSACVEEPAPPPLLHDAHGNPLRGTP
jgi:hypothetical protein